MFKTEHWNHDFVLDTNNFFGFVYFIENKLNGKKYIGKKQYFSYSGGKKYKESDWKKYTSSSKHLNADIESFGSDNFYFEILFECKTRGDLTYAESNLQHKNNVLTERNQLGERIWYNASIAAIKFIPKLQHNKELAKVSSTPTTEQPLTDEEIQKNSNKIKQMWEMSINQI
jgi:hypothetical protein